jgi:hypothetical protein
MTRCGLALAILIGVILPVGVILPPSAWAVSQGSSCRLGARAHKHGAQTALACGLAQDPWQDCDEDPWQLSSAVSSRDTFSDPWQDSGDPWQPFEAQAKGRMSAASANVLPERGEDPWQVLRIQVVRFSSALPLRDSGEDPWQPAFADPWQDDVEDPWQ